LELLIYRYDYSGIESAKPRVGANLIAWRPSIRSLKPRDKAWRYVAYSFFHWLKIFGNSDYCSLSVEENGEPRASMLVVPAYFRWPFMEQNDVQLAYVMTHASSRRQGWASYLVSQSIRHLARKDRSIWYVTDTNNVASQKLAENSGFELVGKATPRSSSLQRIEIARDYGQEGIE
jgi:ribosomal protein S18 acetylase RimI-like enzyme